mmetsp:Transcript_39538/g.75757  ORF Transcript_39538/g.75757 Transcript_39538/m.75757 type:complete len:230 (-) Transcript_39538:1864-2553(-)
MSLNNSTISLYCVNSPAVGRLPGIHLTSTSTLGAKFSGKVYPFTYAHNEFVWKIGAVSEFGETMCDKIVVPKTLATTRSQPGKALEAQLDADMQPILQPSGHKKTKKRHRIRFQNAPENELKPAEQVFLGQHGLSKSDLNHNHKESRFNDWQFQKSKFSALVEPMSLYGRIAVTCSRPAVGLRVTPCALFFTAGLRMLSSTRGWALHSSKNPEYNADYIPRTLQKAILD